MRKKKKKKKKAVAVVSELLFLGRSSVFTRSEHFLISRAQELELEDHQSRLEQTLREKMLKEGEYDDMFGAPC